MVRTLAGWEIFGTDRSAPSTFLCRLGDCFSGAFAGEFEAVDVVDEAVQYRVRVGWVGNHGMPILHFKLTCDDGGSPAVSLFEDFQEIMAGLGVEWLQPPVVQDQELDTSQLAADARVAAVATRQHQFAEQFWHALVED